MNQTGLENTSGNYFWQRSIQGKALKVLSYLIVLVTVIYRKPDAFIHPQLWGEEGTFFYAEAFNQGFNSLFNSCGGYFHVVPRLIAWMCVVLHVPLQAVPFVFAYVWLFVLLLLVRSIWKHVPISDNNRFYFSISLMLIPIQSEIVMNITNLQWLLALFSFIIIAFPKKEYTATTFVKELVVLVLCGFTGPNFIVLMPLFIWIGFKNRKGQAWLGQSGLVLVSVIIGLILAATLVINGGYERTEGEFYWLNPGFVQLAFIQLTYIFIGEFAVGVPFTVMLIVVVMALVLFVYAFVKAIKDPIHAFKWQLLVFAFSFFISVAIIYRFHPEYLNPYLFSPRNFFLPSVAMVWYLILVMENKRLPNYLPGVIMLVMAFHLKSFVKPINLEQIDYTYYNQKLQNTDTLTVPINPYGWTMHLDKH